MRGRETGTGASCKSLLCQCTRCLARRPPPFPGPFLPLQRCSAVTASAAQKTSLSHRCDRDGVAEQRAHGSSRWASPREVGIQSPRNVRQSRLPGSTWRHSIVWQKTKNSVCESAAQGTLSKAKFWPLGRKSAATVEPRASSEAVAGALSAIENLANCQNRKKSINEKDKF